jgi:RNA recognition motif-containing protein
VLTTHVLQLPWSTSNEDLVELFQTTGKVDEAEILFEHGRSKGVGVVQFATVGEAETAIAKFNRCVMCFDVAPARADHPHTQLPLRRPQPRDRVQPGVARLCRPGACASTSLTTPH